MEPTHKPIDKEYLTSTFQDFDSAVLEKKYLQSDDEQLHTHANQEILDKLNVSDNGTLLFDGNEISNENTVDVYTKEEADDRFATNAATDALAQRVKELEDAPSEEVTPEDIQEIQTDIQSLKVQLGEHTLESNVPENAIFSDMTGATQTQAGTAGYVPAPASGAHIDYLRGDGTWQPVLDSLETVMANTQSGCLAGGLALKEAVGTTLTATLAAGETTLVFTDDSITDNSMINVYTDQHGMTPSTITYENEALTLTFDAQETDIRVKVRIS